MRLPDVNVLVYAFRQDSPHHEVCRDWLEDAVAGPAPLGLSELVLSGFLRVVTHPAVFRTPTPIEDALAFTDALRDRPTTVMLSPGRSHWAIFAALCRSVRAKGNLIPDAYFAALAIESGSTWITTDHDFSRFPDLEWADPRD